MCTRIPSSPVETRPCLRVLSRTTATIWVAAALLALLVATTSALEAASTLDGPIGAFAATSALVSLLLVGCLLFSLAAQTLAHVGYWLRNALRAAWDARTPPHSYATDRDPEPTGQPPNDAERAASFDRAVTYLYRCLATSLLLFVGWLVVGTFQYTWFQALADSTVVRVAIAVATFFVRVPLSALPEVVVATGTGQPIAPDVVALLFAVLVVPSIPGVVAMANAVHYFSCLHYDAYHWALAVATGGRYRGVCERAWADHVSVHGVTCLSVAGMAGVAETAVPLVPA